MIFLVLFINSKGKNLNCMCAILKQQNLIKPICSAENLRLIRLLFNYFVRSWAISLERGRRKRRKKKERKGKEQNRPNNNCSFLVKIDTNQPFIFLVPEGILVTMNLLKRGV